MSLANLPAREYELRTGTNIKSDAVMKVDEPMIGRPHLIGPLDLRRDRIFWRWCARALAPCAFLAMLLGWSLAQTSADEPVSPTDGAIDLLKDGLAQFYTWSKETKYDDPLKTYSIDDGVLHISGQTWGGLTTKKTYANYHMIVEFKWGERTWAHRKDRARDSGILVHCYGPDGGYSGTWPASIEAQIIEGGVGDILAVPGKLPDGRQFPISISANVAPDRDGESVWKAHGNKKTIGSGRINWLGRDPDWTDTLGFRGKRDVESPHGEWTRFEIVCDHDKVTLVVNDVVVNRGFDAKPAAGKILFQSEGAEIFVRRWELWPLGKAPADPAQGHGADSSSNVDEAAAGQELAEEAAASAWSADGFRVEVAAAPPLVSHPLMASFDDRGRLFVAESGGVNLDREALERELPGSITILEDTDGDGRFDKKTVFADRLTLPQGVLWHDGAAFVAAPPYIWRFEDTTGDGVADRRDVLVEKFGYTGNAASIHGCFLGPTGRIYWCDGRHGHEFRDDTGGLTAHGKAARIFSCKSDGSDVRAHCGGGMDNPVEIDFTPEGEMLGTVNLMYRQRGDCLVHWMHGGVYPRFDQGPIVAEFPRTGDLLREVYNFGHVAVSGMMRRRDRALGAGGKSELFVTEFNTRKLVRVEVERIGSTFRAEVDDFVSLAGEDSHPTDVLEDADGSMLLIDTGGWFRIGCPTSQIAKPNVLGAIYRIRPVHARPAADPRGRRIDWDALSAADLVGLLGDPRFAVRNQAMAQLARRNESIAPLAEAVTDENAVPALRRGAVWALARIDSRDADAALIAALADPDESVRHAAVFACGVGRIGAAADGIRQRLVADTPAIRRQAATALGQIRDRAGVPVLLEALGADGDRTLDHAIIYALIEIGDRSATARGLADIRPVIRRGALIALDQMVEGQLRRDQVLPLLQTENFLLRKAALEVIAKNKAWAAGAAPFIDGLLRETPTAQSRAVLGGAVIAFSGEELILRSLASALESHAVDVETKCVVLESLGQSGNASLPGFVTTAIETCLADANEAVARQALTTAAVIDADAFRTAIHKLAIDANRSNDLRVVALAALPPGEVLDESEFRLLSAQLVDGEPMQRLAGAIAIGRANLTPAQLRTATDLVSAAGPLALGPLLVAFEDENDSSIGQLLVKRLASSPGRSALTPTQLATALQSFPKEIRTAGEVLSENLRPNARDQAERLAAVSEQFAAGRADRGRQVFLSRRTSCVLCHRIGGEGGAVGPDLTKVGERRSLRDLAEAILYPNASIARGFESMTLVTHGGKMHTGMIVRESGDAVYVRAANQIELRVPRTDIDEMVPSQASIMPSGLDDVMSEQDLVDLLAYLRSLK